MLDLLPVLEPDSAVALYRQIESALAREIEDGALGPGERLAPVRAVAERLRVNFNTVARAYRALERSGHVVTQRGRGTFVRPEAAPAGASLRQLTAGYLARLYRQGYSPQEVRWEFAASIRSWMQAGVPPGLEGAE